MSIAQSLSLHNCTDVQVRGPRSGNGNPITLVFEQSDLVRAETGELTRIKKQFETTLFDLPPEKTEALIKALGMREAAS